MKTKMDDNHTISDPLPLVDLVLGCPVWEIIAFRKLMSARHMYSVS
jgi:hypothetical protein